MEDEVERRTAVAQADLLQRRELVETGRGHGTAGYPGAALVPREEADVECRDQAEDAVGNQPVARPGKEVPRKEGPRGDKLRAAEPGSMPGHARERERHRRHRWQHHRGHHRHPDAEVPAELTEMGARARVHAALHALEGDDPGDERAPEDNRRYEDWIGAGA